MMKRFMILLVATVLVGISGLTLPSTEAGAAPSIWGYIYLDGRQVTQSLAQRLLGTYPVIMAFDKLSAGNDQDEYRVQQWLTGYNSLYYHVPRGGEGNYAILVWTRNGWRTCSSNIRISGNVQLNCYLRSR